MITTGGLIGIILSVFLFILVILILIWMYIWIAFTTAKDAHLVILILIWMYINRLLPCSPPKKRRKRRRRRGQGSEDTRIEIRFTPDDERSSTQVDNDNSMAISSVSTRDVLNRHRQDNATYSKCNINSGQGRMSRQNSQMRNSAIMDDYNDAFVKLKLRDGGDSKRFDAMKRDASVTYSNDQSFYDGSMGQSMYEDNPLQSPQLCDLINQRLQGKQTQQTQQTQQTRQSQQTRDTKQTRNTKQSKEQVHNVNLDQMTSQPESTDSLWKMLDLSQHELRKV